MHPSDSCRISKKELYTQYRNKYGDKYKTKYHIPYPCKETSIHIALCQIELLKHEPSEGSKMELLVLIKQSGLLSLPMGRPPPPIYFQLLNVDFLSPKGTACCLLRISRMLKRLCSISQGNAWSLRKKSSRKFRWAFPQKHKSSRRGPESHFHNAASVGAVSLLSS